MRAATVDNRVGTHALLAKGVSFFKEPWFLLIIDEEQAIFGCQPQGNGLKNNFATDNPIVLPLTATPIPAHACKLSLSGVRDLSILGQRPAGRPVVDPHAMWSEFDGVTIREAASARALSRGQAFSWCPPHQRSAGNRDFPANHR